ncbi:MAG TPA: hypothetical protein VF801_03985 [Rhodocyclaceae bacterium]
MEKNQTQATVCELRFSTLLYRYVFFDWLFADFAKARTVFERQATWRHNKAMRRHLPTYLRRWFVLAAIAFVLGCVFEMLLETLVAACFFTGCAMTVSGMAQICVLWLLLSKPEMP